MIDVEGYRSSYVKLYEQKYGKIKKESSLFTETKMKWDFFDVSIEITTEPSYDYEQTYNKGYNGEKTYYVTGSTISEYPTYHTRITYQSRTIIEEMKNNELEECRKKDSILKAEEIEEKKHAKKMHNMQIDNI